MALVPALLLHEEEGLDAFGLAGFEIHPSVLIGCIALAVGYWWLTGRARAKHGWPAATGGARWRSTFWGLGIATIFFSLNGPLHELSDTSLFSAHMIQHMLLMMVMPPFLLLGLPPELVREWVKKPALLRAGRFLTHPVVAILAYNAVLVLWHLPRFYEYALEHHSVHIVQHLMFMAVAMMMWWPVVAPAPELERIPDGLVSMLYVFVFALIMTLPAAFITMADQVLYPFYAAAARVTSLSALEDQRLGGVIMWVPGFMIYMIAITAIWFRWTKDEYAEWREEARAARAERANAAALARS